MRITKFPYQKNKPNWKVSEMLKVLKQFQDIYKKRPIKKNIHGMNFPHMFALYFILKKIRPKFIIESGVFRGQSSWLIEKACPKAKILSIDIDLEQRKYISKKISYSNLDFKFHDFSNIPKNTLVFFDDHQNHIERLKQSKWFGIKHVVFEDNYPPFRGDFYTLRHSLHKTGFNHQLTFKSMVKNIYLLIKYLFNKKLFKNYYVDLSMLNSRLRDVKPNNIDFKFVIKNIEKYFEFPPLVDIKKNKWNDKTNMNYYKFNKPILNKGNLKNYNIPLDELDSYNSITYLKLK